MYNNRVASRLYSPITLEHDLRLSLRFRTEQNTRSHFCIQQFMHLFSNPFPNFAAKDTQMSDTRFHSSEQLLRILCAPWTMCPAVHIESIVEALRTEGYRGIKWNQKRLNAIHFCGTHPLSFSILLWGVRSGRLRLRSGRLKILRAQRTFSTCQYNLR